MRVPLDARRVVEIRGGWPEATSPPHRLGLLVSDDLILSIAPDTSEALAQELGFALAAIVGEHSEPGAGTGKREWFSCRLAWSSATTEIALFRIDDPHWRNVVSAVPDRLGTFTGGMEWTAALVAGPRPFRVDIHPLNRRSISQFYLRIAEQWAGAHVGPELSGAAVYAGELLIGVLSWDAGVGQVTVLPVTAAFDDPEFRRLLESPVAQPLTLAPVELEDIVQQWAPSPTIVTPADLLDPARAVLPLSGRGRILDQLVDWCDSASALSGVLLTGPASCGKTRLARHLGELMRSRGWLVGELSGTVVTQRRLNHLTRTDRPVLLIADRVDDDGGPARDVATFVADHPPRHPVRLLLLARDADPWWTRWRSRLGDAGLAFSPEPQRLDHIVDTEVDANEIGHAFAGQLGVAFDPDAMTRELDPSEPADASQVRLRMLASLSDRQAHGGSTRAPEDVLISRATDDWTREATRHVPSDDPDLAAVRCHFLDVVRCAMLELPLDRATAIRLLSGLPGLERVRLSIVDQMVDRLHEMYPPRNPSHAYWGRPLPSELAERHLSTLDGYTALFAFVRQLDSAQAEIAVATLGRAALASADLADGLARLIAAQAESLGPPAIRAAARARHPGPLLAALAELVRTGSLSRQLCDRLATAVPTPAGALSTVAIALRNQVISSLEHETSNPSGTSAEVARQWGILSTLFSEAGEPAQALAAARRGVEIHRALDSSTPDVANMPGLLTALRREADCQEAIGRLDLALTLAEEEIRHCRRRIQPDINDPSAHGRLGDALVNLAQRLGETSAAQAIAVMTEAVAHYRCIDHLYGLASLSHALHLLSDLQSRNADAGPAAAAMGACVVALERLANDRPMVYFARLGPAWQILAGRYRQAGDLPAARQAAEQAVSTYRRVAESRTAEMRGLGGALRELSDLQAESGLAGEALHSAQEAVSTVRAASITRGLDGALSADLASALETLKQRFDEVGRPDDSASTAVALVGALRRSTTDDGGQYRLAAALVDLAVRQAGQRSLSQAQLAINDAIDLLRDLPGEVGTRALAAALNNRAIILGELGGEGATTQAAHDAAEAVSLYAKIAGDLTEERARAQSTLSRRLGATGDVLASVAAAEAVVLLRQDQTGELSATRRAAALIDLAERQVHAGQFDRAVTSAMECRVVVQRAEALGSADADDVDAAAALLLAQMGELWVPTQTAVAAARDAVRLYRRLAEAAPAESADKPATALEALASLLSSRAQAWEAIACLHDAVSIRTQLAAGDDTEALRALARLLRTLATRYQAIDETGSTEPGSNLAQAIAAAREASTVSGRIRDQELKGAELAASAQRLSTLLAKVPDQLREALSTAVLAVSLYRNLNGPSPDRYGAPLAGALHWLSLVHRRVGNADPAWRAAAESVDRYRDVCARRPEHRTDLIGALRNLAHLGPDTTGRLVPLRDVVSLYETLNSETPNAYDGVLLNALDNLVAVLNEGGRLYRDELRACRARADELRQRLQGTTGPVPSS